MTKNEIIEKVQKLLRLSGSPNENEAALAAAKAREFLAAHNLTMADVPEDEIRAIPVVEGSINLNHIRKWHCMIAAEIAHLCDTFPVKSLQAMIFVGFEADVKVSTYMATYLFRQIEKMTYGQLAGLRERFPHESEARLVRSYREGAAARIINKIQQMMAKSRSDEAKQCESLIIIKSQATRDYVGKNFGPMGRSSRYTNDLHEGAARQGWADGANVAINPAITQDGATGMVGEAACMAS